jgi:predicted nucleic acid-binding protein
VPRVVADTGPLHYLVLIGLADLLPRLFGKVLVPNIVGVELSHTRTPAAIRDWLSTRPGWLEMMPTPAMASLPWPMLGDGERAAIALAELVGANLILMDDRDAVATARARGLVATGTLGILDVAARAGLTDLGAGLARLRATNFRCRQVVMDEVLALYEADRAAR